MGHGFEGGFVDRDADSKKTKSKQIPSLIGNSLRIVLRPISFPP
jgi:hypothetical protein